MAHAMSCCLRNNKLLRPALQLVLFFSFLGWQLAYGAQPLITDDTGTQGKGKTQLELTGQYDWDNEQGVKTRNGEVKATLSYGLYDPLDLILELPYDWHVTKEPGVTVRDDGVTDLSLSLKWRFFESKSLSFALKPNLSLPSGNENKGLGNGRASYGITSIITYAHDPWALHANVGFTHHDFHRAADRDANRRDIWSASMAAEVAVARRLRFVGDIGVERNSDVSSHTPPAFTLLGVIYALTETVDLDLGVKRGLNAPETDLSLLTGVTFRF